MDDVSKESRRGFERAGQHKVQSQATHTMAHSFMSRPHPSTRILPYSCPTSLGKNGLLSSWSRVLFSLLTPVLIIIRLPCLWLSMPFMLATKQKQGGMRRRRVVRYARPCTFCHVPYSHRLAPFANMRIVPCRVRATTDATFGVVFFHGEWRMGKTCIMPSYASWRDGRGL